MRAAFVFLLVGLVLALAFFLWNGSDELVPEGMGGDDTKAGAPPHLGPDGAAPADPVSPAATGSARALATRTEVDSAPPEDLADRPTACLLVVDYKGGLPIAGAAIRRMKGGATIGFTDERGLVELPLQEREQLEVLAEDYLRRMAPTRLGSTVTEPQRVQLVGDRWSVRRRFELRKAATKAVVKEAFVTIEMTGTVARDFFKSTEDPVERRAREEDSRLRARDASSGFGRRSRRLENGEELRFVRTLPYSIEFATPDGLVQTLEHIAGADAARSQTLRVELVKGDYVTGTVSGDRGRPLAGAVLTQQGGDPLGLRCTTGADGRFEFGPLPRGSVTLLVRHPDHEPTAFGPTRSAEKDVAVTLSELPRSTLRGRVRRRPGLEPIAGATLSWSATANPPVTAKTAADGTFRLAATGDVAGRLLVSAPGCIALEEMVAPGAPFADYDVLPSAASERLATKLTAMLAGTVVDGQSRPRGGAVVRWTPAQPIMASGAPGRRTISGHTLPLSMSVTTKADGSFELETWHFGRGKLSLADGGPDEGISVEAVAGVRTDGLRLPAR